MNEFTVKVILEPSPELAALLRGLGSQTAVTNNVAPAAPARPDLPQCIQDALQPSGPPEIPAAAPTTVDRENLSPSVQKALQPSAPVEAAPTAPIAAPVAPVAPTTDRSYTLEELSKAGAELMDAGKGPEAKAILAQFGVQSLQDLPQAQYSAFAMALRSAGAKI